MSSLMFIINILADFLMLCAIIIIYLYFSDFNFDSLRSIIYSIYVNEFFIKNICKIFIIFGKQFNIISILYFIIYLNIFLKFLYIVY